MTGPVYDVVEVAHVAVSVVAFGSLATTGWFASAVRRSGDPYADAALGRYFRPGRNVAELAVFLVPVLGGALVAMAGDAVARRAWPWIGLGIWLVAAGVATGVVWPAERALQKIIADRRGDEVVVPLARRLERGAAVTSVCFVAALVVMVAKPA